MVDELEKKWVDLLEDFNQNDGRNHPAHVFDAHMDLLVRTLLVVRVRYQARSEVRTLLVFYTEFNHKRKDSEVD